MQLAKEVAKATLTIYKNLPFSCRLLHQDVDGNPINLSAYTAKLVVRQSTDPNARVFYTFSTAAGSIILGNVTIELVIPDAAIVNAFSWNQGVGHLVLQAPDDLPRVYTLFAFTVRTSTTDSP